MHLVSPRRRSGLENKLVAVFVSLFFYTVTTTALWAAGPGLGNVSFDADELFSPIATISSPRGHGNVAMVNGYLMVIYSSDSGGGAGDGGIEFWDVSNPRNPTLAARHDNADTHGLREAHGFGFSNSYPGDYMVTQAVEGVQFWDVSNPLNLRLLSYMDLDGIERGDYSGNWWVFWQAPYVYVAGQGSGLYVIDATNPRAPRLVRRVRSAELGGVNPGMVYAIGNLLVIAGSQSNAYVTADISDPTTPTLIQSFRGKKGYSHLFAAGMLLTSGGNGDDRRMYIHRITHDGAISAGGSVGASLGNGGYGSYQDGFFHSGFSTKYAKFHISSLRQVGTGTSGTNRRDEDFGQVLGNLVFVGDDHGVGSALIAHQRAPDTRGPEVDWVHPKNGANNQALTTRVGLSMSDNVDIESLRNATFSVRARGGADVPGKFSVQMGIVNFSPNRPLSPDTTYDVSVAGIRDLVGNAGPRFSSSFSTQRATVSPPAPDPSPDPDPAPAPPPSDPSRPSCTITQPKPGLVNVPVSFAARVSNASERSWDFADGSARSRSNAPNHTYRQAGRYNVQLTVTRAGLRASCSATQIVHHRLTENRPSHSTSIVFADGLAINVNPDNDTVSAVSQATRRKAWETRVDGNPRTLAQAPDGSIWVVSQDDAVISVLEPDDGGLLDVIDLPSASRPFGIAFDPIEGDAYVSLQGTGELARLDDTGQVRDILTLGRNPRGVAVSGDGKQVLVTQFITERKRAGLWVINPNNFSVRKRIGLFVDPGPDTEDGGRGVANYLTSVVISPDGRQALVPSKKDNLDRGDFRDGNPLNFESMIRTIVSRINLANLSEDRGARIDLNDRNLAQAITYSPLGDLYFVAAQGSNKIEIFATGSGELIGSLNSGRAPQGLVMSDDGATLYVHNFLDRSVSMFDTAELVAGTSNEAPRMAEVKVVARERLATGALRGKRIFYNSADPKMSKDGYVSCASCHLDGGADGQVWDFTQAGQGLRNTITLRGRAGLGHGRVHWSANFDEIQDFEQDIRTFAGGRGFMSNADFAATRNPLGARKSGKSVQLDDLAAYVSSLRDVVQSPFKDDSGELSARAKRGRDVFVDKGCAECHSGPTFSDGRRHKVGTAKQHSGAVLRNGGIDTPTLLGVWNTAPYLHDGSAETLDDVLRGTAHVGALDSQSRSELVAYMREIDSGADAPDNSARPSPAPQPVPSPAPPRSPSLSLVSVVASDRNAAEFNINQGVFRISRNNTRGELEVRYTVGGSATPGADYRRLSGRARFTNGQRHVSVTIVPAADARRENAETVVLRLSNAAQYTIGSNKSATVTIKDAPTVTNGDATARSVVSVTAADRNAAERSGNVAIFRLTRIGNLERPLTVQFEVGGTARRGADYRALPNTIRFAAGQRARTLTVRPVDDAAKESTETVTLKVRSNSGYTLGRMRNATVTIADND